MAETLKEKLNTIFLAHEYVNSWHVFKAVDDLIEQIKELERPIDFALDPDIKYNDAIDDILKLIAKAKQDV